MIRQAVLLVGGKGTRMWPLTAEQPKGLLPVAGVPFIELQFRLLAGVGVQEVILAVDQTHQSAWKDYARGVASPRVVVSVEETPLDTAGPVCAVCPQLDDRFLVLNGDVVLEGELERFVAEAPELPAVLALVEVADTSAYGVVVTAPDGRVERFVEKPPPETAPAKTINAGMYLMSRQVLERYPPGEPLSFERAVFPALVESGELGAMTISGEWLDIGTPDLYLDAHDAVAAGRSRLVQFAEGEVSPWRSVSSSAVVEPGAVVEEAVLLDGAIVRRGATVRRAVIGWGAEIESRATVTGSSIVGAGAVVGAGCEIDRGARIAPNTKLAPGSVTFSPPENE